MYIGEHLRLLLALVSIRVQEYVCFSCAAFLLRIVSWVSNPGQICTAVRYSHLESSLPVTMVQVPAAQLLP